MKRRRIIQSIAVTAAPSMPAVAWWTSRRNALDDGTGFDIQDVFLDKDQVRELGKAYRTRYPGEYDHTLLRTLIAPSGAST